MTNLSDGRSRNRHTVLLQGRIYSPENIVPQANDGITLR